MVVTTFDDKYSLVLIIAKRMPINVKTVITITQTIFRMTEVVTNRYGYPCKDVDLQKSLNTFAVWAFESFFCLIFVFEECILNWICRNN